jgi:hypothetical protein
VGGDVAAIPRPRLLFLSWSLFRAEPVTCDTMEPQTLAWIAPGMRMMVETGESLVVLLEKGRDSQGFF